MRTLRLKVGTLLAFIAWSMIEIRHGSWMTIAAALLWGYTGYLMGECDGMNWMAKIWKLPGADGTRPPTPLTKP